MVADLAGNLIALAEAKAEAQALRNIEFRVADMLDLGYPDGSFDAVVCVFGIFFVPDMAGAVVELWRMVRPGGRLAITTWGPRLFEPANGVFWEAVEAVRPDLHRGFNPSDRISEPAGLRAMLAEAGVQGADIVAEAGTHPLGSPEDWRKIAMGSGYRGTLEQLEAGTFHRIREMHLSRLQREKSRPSRPTSSMPWRPSNRTGKSCGSKAGSHALAATSPGLAMRLYRRALHGTVGAENTAIARLGTEQDLAILAFVIELASIRGHGLPLGETASGTGDDGFQDEAIHGCSGMERGGIADLRGGLDQGVRGGPLRVVGDRGGFPVEIDFGFVDSGDPLQSLPDRDRADRAIHAPHVQHDGPGCAGEAQQGWQGEGKQDRQTHIISSESVEKRRGPWTGQEP